MASIPQANAALPLFYNQLEALSSIQHGDWKTRVIEGAPYLTGAHAVPLTAEEFPIAQRHYPIVFAVGDDGVPLALMGLNEGVNVFVDEDGRLNENIYLPAYARRYPYLLARLTPASEELSLCFDPSANAIGPGDEGEALFADGEPTEATRNIMAFCEQFEMAGQRTAAFMKELRDNKLLIDGEVTIQPEGAPQPYIYRGFQMVSEEALRNLRGDVARKLIQSGVMGLIYAHLFSLAHIQDVFGRQVHQGKMPPQMVPPPAQGF